jgi:hypothetical protein
VCLESTGRGFGDDVCASVGEDYGTKCGAVPGMKMIYYLTCNCPLCTWCFYHTDITYISWCRIKDGCINQRLEAAWGANVMCR